MTMARAMLLLLMLLPLLLQGGTLAHTHFGAPAGIYNQEHDLTLLAASNGAAAPLAAVAGLVVVLVAVTLAPVALPRAPVLAAVAADSRAPPTR